MSTFIRDIKLPQGDTNQQHWVTKHQREMQKDS